MVFAAAIFAVLWLIQTVFLQSFYARMAIANLNRTAQDIVRQKDAEDFLSVMDEAAARNSLLVFLVDEQGEVLYSADQYSALYGAEDAAQDSHANPYASGKGAMNWEKGALRNLPRSHAEPIEQLLAGGQDSTGYTTEDGTAYVFAARLGACGAFPEQDVILCISMTLTSVEAATGILRVQLVWMSVLSLLLSFLPAFVLSRKFERPVRELSLQARRISQGTFDTIEKTGFCTELDDLTEALNHTARSLEQLERFRRGLLAGVSHDLRTPLTMMKGYAEMLQAFSWKDERTRNHDLAVIQREADRLTALVNEILEYASMQANGLKLRLDELDLSETVQAVSRQFEALVREQGCVMESAVEPGLHVQGDRRQLERVIYNLMDNAVHHAGSGRRVAIRLAAQQGRVRFSVQDSGPGIPEEELPYIWDRYRTARNRKNSGAVSGLGLSIVREILTAHGASFGVSCAEGCTFWFEMPVQHG